MNIPINSDFIYSLRDAEGTLKVSLSELQEIVELLEDKTSKAVILDKQCFVVFAELVSVEFNVSDFKKDSDVVFLSNQGGKVINVSKKNGNYFLFIINEFIQGHGFWSRLWRLARTLLPLALLNLIAYFFMDTSGLNEVFAGLLTAVSIFIAIFSLFVTSHDYLSRKRLHLFESGQLSYYFAVDKYITQTGIFAIILCVFGIMISSAFNSDMPVFLNDPRNILTVIILNLSFLAVYIILRSMVEFYIIRPGRFLLGDLKAASFDQYRKNRK